MFESSVKHLSFIEFWNKDERTYKKAIFNVAKYLAVAMMMSPRKRNHQAKPSFRGKFQSLYVEIIVYLNISCYMCINFCYFYVRGLLEHRKMRVKCEIYFHTHTHTPVILNIKVLKLN